MKNKTLPNSFLDVQQQVTYKIIEQLEKGTIPWKKPFIGNSNLPYGLPHNFTTDAKYKGINILLLWTSAIEKNYPINEWATLKQWNKIKESIKPNEKGNLIVKYDVLEREKDGEIVKIPYIKKSYVFNRCQLKSYEPTETSLGTVAGLFEASETIEEFVSNTKAVITHEGFEAFYNSRDDKITMPPHENFIETDACSAMDNYYTTLFHELGHWTKHPTRLNRVNHKKFADQNYAKEELVAELTASFLGAKFEIISPELENSAAYIATWLKVLKDDKDVIFTAASHASKALEFLEGLQPE
jgi:antirestriction protein ArdC